MARFQFHHNLAMRAAFAVFLVGAMALRAQADVRPATVIAYAGEQVPGAPAGTLYSSFFDTVTITNGISELNSAVLNDNGDVTFISVLSGPAVSSSTNQAVLSSVGGMHFVARKGDLPTGTTGAVAFDSFGFPNISPTGDVAFAAALSGADVNSVNSNGIWTERGGEFQLVARNGDLVSGLEDTGIRYANIASTTIPLLAPSSAVAFIGGFIAPGQSTANISIFADRGDGLRLEFAKGQDFSSVSPGVVLDNLVDLSMANNTRLTFTGVLAGSGVSILNDTAIFNELPDGTLNTIVREGQQAPGFSPGNNFFVFGPTSPFGAPLANSASQIAFASQVNGNKSGVFENFSGDLQLALRPGVAVPGIPSLVPTSIRGFGMHNGDMVFSVALPGSGTNEAILTRTGGAFSLLAHTGDSAPDLPGFVIRDLNSFLINERGQILVDTFVRGSDNSVTHAVFAQDAHGVLHLLVREGDQIEVSPGDVRTIQHFVSIGGTDNDDGRRSGFNDNGYYAYKANFTDGSQALLVSDAVAVPEPATWALTAAGALMIFGRAWRRSRPRQAAFSKALLTPLSAAINPR